MVGVVKVQIEFPAHLDGLLFLLLYDLGEEGHFLPVFKVEGAGVLLEEYSLRVRCLLVGFQGNNSSRFLFHKSTI
jgi:hypothetical protein